MLKGSVLEDVYYRFLNRYFIPCCVFLRLKANHLSFLGMLSGLGAGIAFVFSPFWGGVLTLLAGFLDSLDGALARELNQVRRQGAFLDSVLDRYCEYFILVGIWAYFLRKGSATPLITLTVFLVFFGALEERVDEGGDGGTFHEDEKGAEQQQDHDQRDQPPLLLLLQESEEFAKQGHLQPLNTGARGSRARKGSAGHRPSRSPSWRPDAGAWDPSAAAPGRIVPA